MRCLFFAPKVPLSRAFQICVQKLNQRTHFNFFPIFLSNVHQKGGSFFNFRSCDKPIVQFSVRRLTVLFSSKLGLQSPRAFKLSFSSPLCPISFPQRSKKHVPIRPLFTCFPPILLSNFTTCEYAFLFNCSVNEVSTPCTQNLLWSTIAHNVLQLPEGGDFEALHCQPSTNFDRSTKLDLTTEPPLLGRCCYMPLFSSFGIKF